MNIQDWFPLGLTRYIFQCPGIVFPHVMWPKDVCSILCGKMKQLQYELAEKAFDYDTKKGYRIGLR